MRPVTRIAGVLAALALATGGAVHAQGLDAEGWILFEHFGQKPDGSSAELDFDQRWIWLARPDGSELHELAPGTPVHGKASPDVSPDGRSVVFNSWLPRAVLWEVAIESGEPRELSEGCSGRDNDCMEWDPAYSADGERVAFVHVGWEDGAGYTELGIRELSGGPPTYLTSTRVPLDEGDLAQPSWAPDGSRIAYHVNRDWEPHPGFGDYPASIRIWIVGADGADPRPLAAPEGTDSADADWSPDGSRIVYSTVGYRESEGVGDVRPAIYTIDPNGYDPRLLCQDGRDVGCIAPTWLPGGDRIMYWGFRTWHLMDADGNGKRPIDAAHLTWFADGLGYGYFATWVPPQE